MSQPLLQVKDLAISFKDGDNNVLAVKRSSFSVNRGEFVAVVGESGSGKSVTALAMMQLLPANASIKGRILFTPGVETVDLLNTPPASIRKIRGREIAMIFQEPMTSLNPVFTCGHQVYEAIRLHEKLSGTASKQKTIGLFEKVKLPDPEKIYDRYPHQLSGGQKQRVMIAMAISSNPSLLIADEPTTALDVTIQKSTLDLIRELQTQSNMSVILITHDLGLVHDFADRVVVMYRGDIVEEGHVQNIFNNPIHPYTKALLACNPARHKKNERLPVIADFMSSNESIEPQPGSNEKNLSLKKEASGIPVSDKDIVLQVKNLSVHFTSKDIFKRKRSSLVKAVDDVSFTIRSGETMGLVGESGCGKSTLGRTILRLIPVTSGTILLNGMDLATLTRNELRILRRNLQVVFQDPYGSLNPRMTIGNAILEPLEIHGLLHSTKQRKEKVIDLLEKVDLKSWHFNRYPHEFSGGQRQRICIARALALDPSFLIFDESVSSLDVSIQAQVLNLLNDLKKQFHFTSIFISHDLSVVHFFSDRIMVMYKGRIIEEGTADEIYYSPGHEYTKQLVDSVPGREKNVRGET